MFQVASYISKITTMGNCSLRLQVDLDKELNPDENAKIFALYNKLGWFIFKEAEIKPDDIDVPEFLKDIKTDKSPQQRLRAVLFRLWEQQGGGKTGLFDDFYKRRIEMLIDQVKEKLD